MADNLFNPAAQPTNLSPASRDFLAENEDAVLAWQFNSGGGKGSAYCSQVEINLLETDSTILATTLWVVNNDTALTVKASDFTIDGSRLSSWRQVAAVAWRVRTVEGPHDGDSDYPSTLRNDFGDEDYGPWSDMATVQVAVRPYIGLSYPRPGSTVLTGETTVAFNVTGCDSLCQVAVSVYEGTSGDNGIVRGSAARVRITRNSELSYTVSELQNGMTYFIVATVGNGYLLSQELEVSFTTSFATPYSPYFQVGWDDDNGFARITLTEDTSHGTVSPDYFVLQAYDPETLKIREIGMVKPGGQFIDRLAKVDGYTFYEAWGVKEVSTGLSNPWQASGGKAPWVENVGLIVKHQVRYGNLADRKAFLTSKDGKINLQIRWNPEFSASRTLVNSERHYFAGRKLPVMIAGEAYERIINLSWSMLDSEYSDNNTGYLRQCREAGHYPKPLMYRGPHMDNFWAMTSGYEEEWDRSTSCWRISLTLTEVEADA